LGIIREFILVCASKKEYECEQTRETTQHNTYTQNKIEEQLVVRNDMDVNEHERLSNITLRHKLK